MVHMWDCVWSICCVHSLKLDNLCQLIFTCRATIMECRHATNGDPICVKSGQNFGQLPAPGDSGGPLLPSPQGPVLGVVSHGVTLPNLPDIIVEYASVARMLDFVRSNI
ncbi:unnamed protein product [Schistosoma intercalatum]|nr:unnamed protein product [Schistosoma intercalatum]CAH8574912.1 unnamed protein product [Schistosoma intercalatum]CAH8574923.1 unnamed protein product [Schistosoma intercalatum]CAH8576528.1 unnamed protein product [Schistosoma intercalatum]